MQNSALSRQAIANMAAGGGSVREYIDPERHGLGDRRLRQFAVNDRLKDLSAGHASHFGHCRLAVFISAIIKTLPCTYK